jgi:hypothetical protein
VNQHGSEGQLETAFGKEAARYKGARGAPLSYTAFDFHKECGAKNYERWVADILRYILTCVHGRDISFHNIVLDLAQPRSCTWGDRGGTNRALCIYCSPPLQ